MALVADLFYEQVCGCEQCGSVVKALFELPFVGWQTIALGELTLKCGRAHCTSFRHLGDCNLAVGKLRLKLSKRIGLGSKGASNKNPMMVVILSRCNCVSITLYLAAELNLPCLFNCSITSIVNSARVCEQVAFSSSNRSSSVTSISKALSCLIRF